MTVTSNEFGQQNLFAKEPNMYISDEDAKKYGMQSHNERAEILNGRFPGPVPAPQQSALRARGPGCGRPLRHRPGYPG